MNLIARLIAGTSSKSMITEGQFPSNRSDEQSTKVAEPASELSEKPCCDLSVAMFSSGEKKSSLTAKQAFFSVIGQLVAPKGRKLGGFSAVRQGGAAETSEGLMGRFGQYKIENDELLHKDVLRHMREKQHNGLREQDEIFQAGGSPEWARISYEFSRMQQKLPLRERQRNRVLSDIFVFFSSIEAEVHLSRTIRNLLSPELAALWTDSVERRLDQADNELQQDALEVFFRDLADRGDLDHVQNIAAEFERAQAENVHAIGRGRLTRASVHKLIDLRERVDVARQLDALRQFIKNEINDRNHSRLDVETLNKAEEALFGTRGMPGILAAGNSLVDGINGIWLMRDIVARVWQELDFLSEPPLPSEHVVKERRQAFLGAAANCMWGDELLCPMGQAQRLLLVLQGFVPGIEIEVVGEQRELSVSEYITQSYLERRRVLENAMEHEVGPIFDDMYRAGLAMFTEPQKRAELAAQLKTIVAVDFELEWEP